MRHHSLPPRATAAYRSPNSCVLPAHPQLSVLRFQRGWGKTTSPPFDPARTTFPFTLPLKWLLTSPRSLM